MALTNSYATLDEFLGQIEAASHKPEDDVYIERLLERCSREFDGDTQHHFYSYTETRRYDLPRGLCLELDAPLLSVTSLTNGDGTLIASTEYDLTPYNGPHHTGLELHADSTTQWQPSTGARTRGVVYVAGAWGYVNRTATDPESARIVANTKTATLALALNVYRKRYGVGTDGAATITGAGVVITPRDKSREYHALVNLYARKL
jgi:hypothetical protein